METFYETEIAKDMAHLASLINKAEHFDKILGIEDDPGAAWEDVACLKDFWDKHHK